MVAVKFTAAALAALAVAGGCGAKVPARRVPISDFQSFLANWDDAGAPLCAQLTSADDWNRLFHPAPIMGGHRRFAPAPDFWRRRSLLVFAHVTPGGGKDPFSRWRVDKVGRQLEVDLDFTPSPPASYTVKSALLLAVPKQAAVPITFKENGKVACSVASGDG